MKHLMIDLETMGTGSSAAIMAIGAVVFDIETGKVGDIFYRKIDLQSSVDLGLKIDASTVMWWLKQNKEARHEMCKQGVSITSALDNLKHFIATKNTDFEVWANSARFDLGILDTAYRLDHTSLPWHFYKERCVRTLLSFMPDAKKQVVNMGTAHNAVDDCLFQIRYCSVVWQTKMM